MADNSDESLLRDTFVEMLFALTVGEIGLKFADIAKIGVNVLLLPTLTHLLLAIGIVTTSWVGWKKSRSPGKRKDVDNIFSWPFLILLLDVGLVICYFIIARGAEVISSKNGNIIVEPPSATSETFWLMIIFIGYIIWDFVANVIVRAPNQQSEFRNRFIDEYFKFNSGNGKDGYLTVICFGLSFFCYCLLRHIDLTKTLAVVYMDLALLSLVFLFRALKQNKRSFSVLLFTTFVVFLAIALIF